MTVVLPVYNAGPYLVPCLDSLAAQELAPEELEVVAVDDGSTDGSGERLDEFAAAHPSLCVLHQENSGWPGRPRNVGTRAARGEFVFYLDADDSLTPDALARMLAFAREHGSDIVVVGRVTMRGDRVIRPHECDVVRADAPLAVAFRSLTVHKLFRRRLLAEHDLRFPEEELTFEDGIFLAQAAALARRISLLDDRVYYVKRIREDGGNIARRRRGKPIARAQSLARIIATVSRLHPDPEAAGLVARRLYRRLLRTWNARAFLKRPRTKQDALVAIVRGVAAAHVPPFRDAELPYRLHLRSLAFRTGSTPVVVALAQSEEDRRRAARLRRPRLWPLLARAQYGRWAARGCAARRSAARRARRARRRLDRALHRAGRAARA